MNENPVDLDKHRGMAAQKATDIRRVRVIILTDRRFCVRGKTDFRPWVTVRPIAGNSYRFLAPCAHLSD